MIDRDQWTYVDGVAEVDAHGSHDGSHSELALLEGEQPTACDQQYREHRLARETRARGNVTSNANEALANRHGRLSNDVLGLTDQLILVAIGQVSELIEVGV